MLLNVYSPDHFRQQAHQLVDTLADYLQDVESQIITTVIPYQTPDEALSFWQADFDNGQGDVDMFFKEVLARSTHLHHPRYMGHQVPHPKAISFVLDLRSCLSYSFEVGMKLIFTKLDYNFLDI